MNHTHALLHRKTPIVSVRDGRGCAVRSIAYLRASPEGVAQPLVTCTRHDVQARQIESIDPRQLSNHPVDPGLNVRWAYSLSGQVVREDSCDSGCSLALFDIQARIALARTGNNAIKRYRYQAAPSPGHLLAIDMLESPQAQPVIAERLVWADSSPDAARNNVAGQLLRHYDDAGVQTLECQSLQGVALRHSRQLRREKRSSGWPGVDESSWREALADEVFASTITVDASGQPVIKTDAGGHLQRYEYDICGQLAASWLQVVGAAEQSIVKSVHYNADGQLLCQTHGNDVVSSYNYEPGSRRLLSVHVSRPAGHPSGARTLQDMRYRYDPVGNVTAVADQAQATRFWRNQRVTAESTYAYDSLYRLTRATGREMARRAVSSGRLPDTLPQPLDTATYTNYTRTYQYDIADNLTEIRHQAAASSNDFTRHITVARKSNRALMSDMCADPDQVDTYFLLGGQQQRLPHGQLLAWGINGDLEEAGVPGSGLWEWYRYDADHQRRVKVSTVLDGDQTCEQATLYLPDIELRTTHRAGRLTEQLQVLSLASPGPVQVNALSWQVGEPDGLQSSRLRYSYRNQIGSAGLELDAAGQVVSQEEYYPFGATALYAARAEVEASYKTLRYSGKELDASGLYYYGYRYYQPWASRWLSADPSGATDGLNLYRMVHNNPITLHDPNGLETLPPSPVTPSPSTPMALPPTPAAPVPSAAAAAAPAAVPPPPPPMAPPMPSGGGADAQPKRKFVVDLDSQPALHKQQGGEYPYYSSMTIALQKLGIEHYSNIPDVDSFLQTWATVGLAMSPPARQIDRQKLSEVQATFARMDREWSGYKKATVSKTFRGESPAVLDSYPWLANFAKQTLDSDTVVEQRLDMDMKSPVAMSTSKDPRMHYVKPRNIMWDLTLAEGHAGVSEGLYASEGEVTFPLYNPMRVETVTFIPEGQAYKGDAEQFGTAHRYVIKATMLPRR